MLHRTQIVVAGLLLGLLLVGVLLWMRGTDGPVTRKDLEANVRIKVINAKGHLIGPVTVERVVKSDEEWRAQLSPAQFEIARGKGTERAFCGTLLDNKRHGVYACVCCRLPLFTSASKFNSRTGWPSFFAPICDENVVTITDKSHGMARVEILCARCDCHLGHVFEDGPNPTGLRYCVNSESLVFVDEANIATLADPAADSVSEDADS